MDQEQLENHINELEHELTSACNIGMIYKDEIERIRHLFENSSVTLVKRDGVVRPVKNTSKNDCYNLLFEIQELIESRGSKNG